MQGIEKHWNGCEEWRWYYLETLDYAVSQSSSRILVTKREISELRNMEFDPFTRGGPVYCERQGRARACWALRQTQAYNGGGTRRHAVEFLREADYR